MNKTVYVVFFLMALSSCIYSYEQIQENGKNLHWNDEQIPVPYMINSNGTGQVEGEFDAIHRGFETWSSITSASISFTFAGMTSITSSGLDSANVITWADLTTQTDMGIAESIGFYSLLDGSYIDVDIVFSNFVAWATDGRADAFDIQAVATHEIGHMVGLADLYASQDSSKVMYGYINPGDLAPRVLSEDDIAGASAIYPPGGNGNEGSDGGGCFIATAAYGTPLAEEVVCLTYFRDMYLMPSPIGRSFVAFYYKVSPGIAQSIKNSEILRTTVRIILNPVVKYIRKHFPEKQN